MHSVRKRASPGPHVTMFKNKVVIITGASSELGKIMAFKFTREGASVVLVGRNEEKLKNVKKQCDEEGPPAFIIKADLTEDTEVERVIEETIKKYKKLDVLVNNVSIVRLGNIIDGSILDCFDDVMDTNLRIPIALTSYATKYLIESKGNIVNVSSIGANRIASIGLGSYCISHAGLNHFTRTAAAELGKDGVRVNSVSPEVNNGDGSILQPLLNCDPKETEENADLVLYLASDDAQCITGSNYTSDQGALANT